MRAQECRSCQAPIIWVRTTAGRRMPLDAQPTAQGNVVLRDGVATVLSGPAPDGNGRMPHHATCPDAAQWRRRGRKAAQ